MPEAGFILRANRAIGSGHLMRVRPLVRLLKERNIYSSLFVYAFDERLRDMSEVFDEVCVYETKEDILNDLLSADKSTGTLPSLLIIDDYDSDEKFETPLHNKFKIAVIDDLADRKHNCDMLLDTDPLYETKQLQYRLLCGSDCKLLLGAAYSLTDPSFYRDNFIPGKFSCTCKAHSRRYRRLKKSSASCVMNDSLLCPLSEVLVSFGGADPVSATLTLLTTILRERLYCSFRFTVLAGPANSDFEKMQELIAAELPELFKDRITLIRQCRDVADLLYCHDLAVGACGGMMKERIITGLPSVGVLIADNQKGADTLFEKFGLGEILTTEDLKDGKKVKAALRRCEDRSAEITENCFKLYDGQGLKRIADALESLL